MVAYVDDALAEGCCFEIELVRHKKSPVVYNRSATERLFGRRCGQHSAALWRVEPNIGIIRLDHYAGGCPELIATRYRLRTSAR